MPPYVDSLLRCVSLSGMPGRHRGIGMNKPRKTKVEVPKLIKVRLLLRGIAAADVVDEVGLVQKPQKVFSAVEHAKRESARSRTKFSGKLARCRYSSASCSVDLRTPLHD